MQRQLRVCTKTLVGGLLKQCNKMQSEIPSLKIPIEGSSFPEVIWKVLKSMVEGTQHLILAVTFLMLLIRLMILRLFRCYDFAVRRRSAEGPKKGWLCLLACLLLLFVVVVVVVVVVCCCCCSSLARLLACLACMLELLARSACFCSLACLLARLLACLFAGLAWTACFTCWLSGLFAWLLGLLACLPRRLIARLH
jgi:hypothetical protein